nr:hypothetical protein 9 [bacterium]
MTTLSAESYTLIDIAKSMDPNGNIAPVINMLAQQNKILDDIPWLEGNLPTGHQITIEAALPTGIWRRYNQGTPTSRDATVQVTEPMAQRVQRMKVDKDLASLNGNLDAFIASKSKPQLEAIGQTVASALFYGDYTNDADQFLGLAPRYDTISGATNGQNILSGGGTDTDMTSIWLVCWGEEAVHGIYPKGSQAGVDMQPIMDGSGDGCVDQLDAGGNPYRAYVREFKWKCGMAVPDWRYVVRIANLDSSAMRSATSAPALLRLMAQALDIPPMLDGSVKPCFYMNRTTASYLKHLNATTNAGVLTYEEGNRGIEERFLGVPIRKCDAILNTETQIS